MINEIYTRQTDDPDYAGNLIESENKLESVLSKVRMILGTNRGDVLGEYEFGVDLQKLVFSTTKTHTDIENIINDAFNRYINRDSEYTVVAKVQLGKHGDGYDYALVDVQINNISAQKFMVD